MIWDERKAQPPDSAASAAVRPNNRKNHAPADFFFVIPTNDQFSHHQHPRPAVETNRKDTANAQASPDDGRR
ncbi:hypothetical protein [Mesobacterium pallidum]|uniref:hypothetical protein n=1 Tax=Mesobacterium pallidum TaxID=2872037 RepID=UPI001EE22A55|nr:hypothetical protein [Mesobacterium pallidum]